MHNQEIQFVVISANENRKQIMQKQFIDLELNSIFNIHYDEAITPNNSSYNLTPIYSPFPENTETICCFLSHVKAMNWYIKNTNKPYLLLLEDDVAIKKIGFKENLLSLIPELEKNKFDYISLGYLPHNISYDLLKHPLIQNTKNIYWDLYKIYLHSTWGTQAQLFPRRTVEFYLSVFNKLTIEDIFKSIIFYLNKNNFYYVNPPRLQIDSLNGLLRHQAIVFPPMAVELNNTKSLINEKDNHKNIWEDGEIRNLYKLSDYYSYEEKNKLLNEKIPHFKNYIFENIIDLVCKFGSHACEKFKPKY